jgi:hypothetical protein
MNGGDSLIRGEPPRATLRHAHGTPTEIVLRFKPNRGHKIRDKFSLD